MTKEGFEDTSGEGEQECRFEEGGCREQREMENGSWPDCCKSGVNPATPVYGINPDQSGLIVGVLESLIMCFHDYISLDF